MLGSLEVEDEGGQLPLPAQKPRGLLALLLLRANEVVRAEQLIEELWAGSAPESAPKLLQGYVSQLRKLLEPPGANGERQLLLTKAGGYSLRLEAKQLDALQFERLLGEGQQLLAREPGEAARKLAQGLALWRGPALADFRYEQFAQQEINRLEELRLVALEERIEAELALGNHQQLVAELEGLIAEQPLRERLRAQLMLALYRSGRQAEALDAYRKARETLIEELGIEPSPNLVALEKAILQQEESLLRPPLPPTALAEGRGAPAGTVSFLFTDIEGSTRLLQEQGEGYRELLAEHRELLRAAASAQKGYEVDAQGDALLFAFASAQAAIQAALAAQRSLLARELPSESPLRVRIGIHTGEPTLTGEGYVGIDLHRGARICAAAHGGQIVLSQATRDLVAEELAEELSLRDLGEHRLKDLSLPQRLFQLLAEGLPQEFPALRTLENRPTNLPAQPTAFLGRERELEQLKARLCEEELRLLSLTGPGGVGKTRLALQGAADLLERFERGVFFVNLASLTEAELVLPTIAQTLGLRESGGQPLEQTLKEYLRERELLLLLDNLEQLLPAAAAPLAELLQVAPKLKLLVTSRIPLHLGAEQEFPVPALGLPDLQHLPDFASLTQFEAVQLFIERARAVRPSFAVTNENAPAVAEICSRLDGLPLAIELAAARIRVLEPAALLRRLDRRLKLLTSGAADLDPRQRTLRATIDWSYGLLTEQEKVLFARLGVFVDGCRVESAQGLFDPADGIGTDVLDGLISLVEQSLLHRRADADGEPRFWMLETVREYALEAFEATGVSQELRRRHAFDFLSLAEQVDAESRTGDQQSGFERLDAEIGNLRAAIAWSGEAGEADILLRLVTALWGFWATRGHVAEGTAALEEALALSPGRPARALLGFCTLRLLGGSGHDLLCDVEEVIRACEQLGDDYSLAQAWNLLGRVQNLMTGTAGERAWRQALTYAERGNYVAERAESIGWLMISTMYGPVPVEQGIARCRELSALALDDPAIQAFGSIERAVLEAMRGEFELARQLLAAGTRVFQELGLNVWAANTGQEGFFVEMLAGNPRAAATSLKSSYELLEQMGERGFLSTIAGFLAHALYAQAEYDEAERFSRASEQAASPDDVFSQILWRTARAKVCARRGDLNGAESLARNALDLAEQTDLLNTQGDALVDLAEVLALGGRRVEARVAAEEAARRYERKGNLPSLKRARRIAKELARPLDSTQLPWPLGASSER